MTNDIGRVCRLFYSDDGPTYLGVVIEDIDDLFSIWWWRRVGDKYDHSPFGSYISNYRPFCISQVTGKYQPTTINKKKLIKGNERWQFEFIT